jgi:hypothetical protein
MWISVLGPLTLLDGVGGCCVCINVPLCHLQLWAYSVDGDLEMAVTEIVTFGDVD